MVSKFGGVGEKGQRNDDARKTSAYVLDVIAAFSKFGDVEEGGQRDVVSLYCKG